MENLITILGPTASGKSSLGIKLAKNFDGEIISADSRQIYRGLDIGSGKVTREERSIIPHHLLDIVNPMDNFSVVQFQKLAFQEINSIIKRKKQPFIVGGTALYIYSVIDNYNFANIAPNEKIRKNLKNKTKKELQKMVPKAALNKEDYNNPRRLIRAIEKINAGVSINPQKNAKKYNNIILGINIERKELYKKIDKRVNERLKQGMIEEVKNLRAKKVSDEWLINLGLEYKWITKYLQGNCSHEEMISRLKSAIHDFARRQMTWFNRDGRIHWIKNANEAKKEIKKNQT